jgi:hypothetical protein
MIQKETRFKSDKARTEPPEPEISCNIKHLATIKPETESQQHSKDSELSNDSSHIRFSDDEKSSSESSCYENQSNSKKDSSKIDARKIF